MDDWRTSMELHGTARLWMIGVPQWNSGLETNARPRRVKFRPGEWFIRPDQPGGRVGILRGFIDHIVIAGLVALI